MFREKSLLWKKKLPGSEAAMIGVANNGLLLVRTKEGLRRYYASGEEAHSPIDRYKPKALSEQSASLGGILVQEFGGGLVIEKRVEKGKVGDSLLGFLKKGKGDPGGAILHEIVHYELASEQEDTIWKYQSEKDRGRFLWAAIADLSHMVVSEEKPKAFPQRGTVTKMLLLQPKEGRSIYEVSLTDTRVTELSINADGVVMARLEAGGEAQYLGLKPDGEKFFITPPKPGVVIRYLGRKFLLLEEIENRMLHFLSFDDKPLFSLDLKIFDSTLTKYQFFFQPNDDPILVSVEPDGRSLEILYTSLDHLPIQYEGWLLESERRRHKQALEAEKESAARDTKPGHVSRIRTVSLSADGHGEDSAPVDAEPAQDAPVEPPEWVVEEAAAFPPPQQIEHAVAPAEAPAETRETPLAPPESLEQPAAPDEAPASAQETPLAPPPSMEQRQAPAPTNGEARRPDFIPLDLSGSVESPGKKIGATVRKKFPEKAAHDSRIGALLKKLDDRFSRGEVSEKAYRELRAKYASKLWNPPEP